MNACRVTIFSSSVSEANEPTPLTAAQTAITEAIRSAAEPPPDYESFRVHPLASWIESVFGIQREFETQRWIRQALPKLTGRSAEMFVLRYVQDFDNREIASMFQTSQAVVAVTLFRTRTQLQKDFKAYMRGTR